MKPPDKTQVPVLLVGAEDAAWALGIGRTSFLLADKTGELGPQSVKIGGRRLWVVAELSAWVLAGCPARQRWVELWRGRAGASGGPRPENVEEKQDIGRSGDATQPPGSRGGLRVNCRNLSLTEPVEDATIRTL